MCHCTLRKLRKITHTCPLWVSGWGEGQALLVCVKEPLPGLLVLKGRYGGHRTTAANSCYQGSSHKTNCHFYSCCKQQSSNVHWLYSQLLNGLKKWWHWLWENLKLLLTSNFKPAVIFISEYSNQWYRSKQKYGNGSYNSHHDQTAPQVPGIHTGSPV